MATQRLLWINRDADNFKSREYIPAINAHIQHWKKANTKARYKRARELQPTVSRAYIPCTRRQEGDEPAYQDVLKILPERLKSPEPGVGLVSSYPSLIYYDEAPAIQDYQILPPNEYRLGPCWQEGRDTSPMSFFRVSPSTTSLDPFFRLPIDISNRDKNLLHLYFATMPRLIYGTHIHAKYCPVRETTTTEIADNALFMQWILLAAEVYLEEAKGVVDRVSIFERKARIYRNLGKIIADPASRNISTTISVLAAASIAEARIGDFELGRKHCVALLHLIDSQGGPPVLRSMMFRTITTRIIVSFVSIGAGHALFANYVKLLTSLQCLKETILAIQAWSKSLFLHDAIRRDSLRHGKMIVEAGVPTHSFSAKVERYYSTLTGAFASNSLLHRFILPIFEDHSPIEQRCHIALLTILVVMLFDLRNEYDDSTHFLEEIVMTVTSGQVVDEVEPPPMKVLTVLYIATDCAERYESVGFDLRRKSLRSWLAVEVLELVQLASDRGRMRILESLSNSLTGGGGKDSFITEDDLTAICDEIRLAWMGKRGMEGL